LAYGPGTKKNDHRVLNSLIQKGLMGDKIELMDGGDAVRTYCYITNVIEMFWNILLFGKKTLYNVGGESKITILELAKTILSITGSSSEIRHLPPLEEGDMTRRLPDTTKMDALLNRPRLSLEEGIRRVLENPRYLNL
jgi:UDP-glucose 4-epimerase